MSDLTIFDLGLNEEEALKLKPIKSSDWRWSMAKDYPPKNGLKVFSCFACGGGSTMGYKLAGCEVLGCCEIDPRMNEVYVKNHNPKYNYLMDIRDFNKIPNENIPEELFNLDILDGSPPCTTFSMSGDREESWGKEKKFAEGQKMQTLDDLSFVFIETVAKLKPKVVIMENVEGLLLGEAFSYVQKIYKQLKEAGYSVHHWLMQGEKMGVPQTRHRTVFVAVRNDLGLNPMEFDMTFNYAPIYFGEIKEGHGTPASDIALRYLNEARYGEKSLEDAFERINGRRSWFSQVLIYDNTIVPTITAGHSSHWRYPEKEHLSSEDVRNATTFPYDYDFCGRSTEYICGMSVPPIMIKRIVTRLVEQGVFNYKDNE